MSRLLELATNAISVGTTSGQLLAPADRRDHLHMQNSTADTIFIRFGTAAAATTGETSVEILPGGEITFHTPGTTAIQAITSGAAARNLTVTTHKDNF